MNSEMHSTRLLPKLMSFYVFGTPISVRDSSYSAFERILADAGAHHLSRLRCSGIEPAEVLNDQNDVFCRETMVTQPAIMFAEVPDALALKKGQNGLLLTRLNAGIATIRADGTWQKINDHWMGH